jgi:hypothetical protein
MMVWITASAVIALASPFVLIQFQRRRDAARVNASSRPADRKQIVRPRNPFAAVSIQPDMLSPCEAVLKVQARRFLAMRAPGLPLSECGRKKCGCRYVRHSDRRSHEDQRDHFGRFGGLIPRASAERRNRDRRKLPSDSG